MPILSSEWIPTVSSAFKQVTPITEEIIPIAGFTFYPGIHEIQQKKTIEQLSFLISDTIDNIPCNSVAIISDFNPDYRSGNFYRMNSISSNLPEKSSVTSNLFDFNSASPNHHISKDVSKFIEHYCQRHNALSSPLLEGEDKIQGLVGLSESSENKTSQENEPEVAYDLNITRKEEDDFVDVVQLG